MGEKINRSFYLIILLLFILVFFPYLTQAATITKSFGGNIIFEIEPQNPGPLQQTKISITSYEIDLSKANISWVIDQEETLEGVGKNTLEFKTGPIGKETKIGVVVNLENKKIIRAISIIPAEIDVVWSAETYTPPFYKGRTLPSPRSTVSLVAIPNFISRNNSKIDSKDLIYEWKEGNKRLLFGKGENRLKKTLGGELSDNTINLIVKDSNSEIIAEKKISIETESPEVIFFKEVPLEGTNYDNSVKDSQSFNEKEFSLRAEPFFFSYPHNNIGNLLLEWKMNDTIFSPDKSTPKIITLRNDQNKEIDSDIKLNILNAEIPSQKATANIKLKSYPGINF